MPAFIQSPGIIAVGGEISAASDSALPISYLYQCHLVVGHRIIKGKIHKVAKGISRMIELGNRLRILIQGIKISLKHFIVVALLVRRVIAALKAFGIKGVDVSRSSAGPGHLKAVDTHKGSALACCNFPGSLTAFLPLTAQLLRVFTIQMDASIIIEGIGMIGNCQEIKVFHFRRMVKCLLHSTRSIRQICMRVKLSEIQLIAVQRHRRFIGKGIHLSCLRFRFFCSAFTGRNISSRFDDHRFIRFRRFFYYNRLGIFLLCLSRFRIGGFRAILAHGVIDFRSLSG